METKRALTIIGIVFTVALLGMVGVKLFVPGAGAHAAAPKWYTPTQADYANPPDGSGGQGSPAGATATTGAH